MYEEQKTENEKIIIGGEPKFFKTRNKKSNFKIGEIVAVFAASDEVSKIDMDDFMNNMMSSTPKYIFIGVVVGYLDGFTLSSGYNEEYGLLVATNATFDSSKVFVKDNKFAEYEAKNNFKFVAAGFNVFFEDTI